LIYLLQNIALAVGCFSEISEELAVYSQNAKIDSEKYIFANLNKALLILLISKGKINE